MGKQRKTTHEWPWTIQNNKKQRSNNAKQRHTLGESGFLGQVKVTTGQKKAIPDRESGRKNTEKLPGVWPGIYRELKLNTPKIGRK